MKLYFEKLYKNSAQQFYSKLKLDLEKNNRQFIVTANPETFSIGEKDAEFNKLLNDNVTTLVPDGIGIVKACKILNYKIVERIPGIDIAIKLLENSNEMKKSIYLLGSKQEVIDKMIEVIKQTYPNVKLLGATNGYVKDKDKIFDVISELKPDVVLVALGIPNQEKLIYKHLNKFKKGIFVGVGGSFDVISGLKKRAPKIFIKTNTEWLFRICCEPNRIKRFFNNNVKFLFKMKKMKKSDLNDEKL